MTRPNPILNFPDDTLKGVVKRLQQTSGRLTPLNTVAHLRNTAGTVVAAGGTVVVEGTHNVLAAADALHNQCRLIVRGNSAAGSPAITVNLIDITNANKVLASTTVVVALGTNIGAWTNVVPWNTDHVLAIQVVGDSVHAQTLYAVESHFRTVKAQ